MASKFLRGTRWWVKFRHPLTGETLRESLETEDPARAELLRQRVELEVALQDRRFEAFDLPASLRKAIVGETSSCAFSHRETMSLAGAHALGGVIARRVTIEAALERYLKFIASDNAPHHVQNKISMLRRFFGTERTEAIREVALPGYSASATLKPQKAAFHGGYVDQIDPASVQEFIDALKVTAKTKRHYRELFHHLFEVWLKFELYQPRSWHRPNPIAALPSYNVRNKVIEFLRNDQIEEQLDALADEPVVQIAVAIMIYAGPRRAETLWLQRGAVAADLTHLSVINCSDPDCDISGSLKTGERAVTILPPLRPLLQHYLETFSGTWLIPDREGRRWSAGSFSRKLRQLNRSKKLRWSCRHYRHTYATQRAAEGWSLFRIAKEMGNGADVVEEYYAAFVRPNA